MHMQILPHIYACMLCILQPVMTSVRYLHRNAFSSSLNSQSIKFLQCGIRGEDIKEADHLQARRIYLHSGLISALHRFVMIHFTIIQFKAKMQEWHIKAHLSHFWEYMVGHRTFGLDLSILADWLGDSATGQSAKKSLWNILPLSHISLLLAAMFICCCLKNH